jgi:phosphatidylglycerophosphatase A
MKTVARIVATFFGVGFFPLIPGTAASAVAVLAYKLVLHDLAWPIYLSLAAGLFFAGVAAAKVYAAELGRPDPGRIVVDEFCGQLITSAFLPGTWIAAGVAFALFRIFDIIKPWPIRKLEKLPGGWGIMADDIAAGLAAAAIARLILPWLT